LGVLELLACDIHLPAGSVGLFLNDFQVVNEIR
jgi:hypothetical protein